MPSDRATSLVPLGDLLAWVVVRDDDQRPAEKAPRAASAITCRRPLSFSFFLERLNVRHSTR